VKSVSENVLDFLRLEYFSLFIDPIFNFLDFDYGLPFIHQWSQTVNFEGVLFPIVDSQYIHQVGK
jgi:hypothetical protein